MIPGGTDLGEGITTIYHGDGILVVGKPRKLITQEDETSHLSLQEIVRSTLPTYEPVHRLDLMTTGLVVGSTDMDSHFLLRRQFNPASVQRATKLYLGIVEGDIEDHGNITARLSHDGDTNITYVDEENGAPARTEYRTLVRYGPPGMPLNIVFLRFHSQIRF